MPTVARWLHDGTHRLTPWWVPIPSTTPASQAAILFGDDTQIPSFRFWDRATGRLLVTNRPGDAQVIESGFDGRSGLLAGGGTAISTAFTGGADNSYLVFSRALKPGGLGSGDAFVPLFSSPFLLPRTVILTVGEVIKELYQSRRQRIRQVQPRIARRFSFVVLRGLTNVFLRTMNLTIIADKIYEGAPVIFVDFVDYDEIAFFHSGSLYGIPMPPGLVSHAPQGVHHGAPEAARERARRKFDQYDRVDWSVIAIDTRRRLTPSAEILANDLGQH